MKVKNVKKILATVMTAALAIGVAGCASSTPVKTDDTGKTKISMVIFSGGGQDTFDNAAAKFNEMQDEIELSIQPATGDYNQYLGARAASNDLPDMFWLYPYAQVQQFAGNGYLMDLSDQEFTSKVYDYTLNAVSYDGKVYAYPLRQEFLGVFYNTELFEKAGITEVPTTLTELKEDCQKLQDAGITPFAATYKDAWTLNHAFSCLEGAAVDKNDNMESWVTSMNDGSGSYKTDKSDNVFEFLDLMKENSGSNYMDSDSTAGFTAFANGDAAMLFSGEFSLLNVATINPDLPVGLFAAPVTDDPLDAKLDVDVGVACVINSQTKNKEACLKVLEYLSDNTSKDGWFATTNDAMGEAVPCMPYEGQYSAKYMDDYKAYMNSGANRPWVYQQLPAGSNTEIGNIIQAYMAGSVDKEQALQQLDGSNQELLNP